MLNSYTGILWIQPFPSKHDTAEVFRDSGEKEIMDPTCHHEEVQWYGGP